MIKVFHQMFSKGVSKMWYTCVAELTEGNGGNLNNGKNCHPVPTRGDGLHSGSDPGSIDLGGIKPRLDMDHMVPT